MRRRTLGLMLTLTVSLLVAPLAPHAQPQGNIPTVGVLEPGPPPTMAPAFCLEAFRHGLGELGYRKGQNAALEERYAAFTPDRLLALAAELVQRQPQVIWTHSNLAAWALKRATTTIPVVVGGQLSNR
jgi:putative ABC transport system substrate-binding protein